MRARHVRRLGIMPLVGTTLLLSACAGHSSGDAGADEATINTYPATFKSDILGGMHAYLNDPTGIRDAAITEPMLKSIGDRTRYVVCVRFNGKQQDGKGYAGVKEIAAVFLLGHLDHFVEKANEQCAAAAYAPFPELGNLTR